MMACPGTGCLRHKLRIRRRRPGFGRGHDVTVRLHVLSDLHLEHAPYPGLPADADVIAFLKATGLKAKQTSVQAPWQNGVAERWVGSCRREILDHVIPLNEEHLRRLLRDFVNYYHQDRVHDSLGKDSPNRRPVEQKPAKNATVDSMPRLGGLHHRYSWRAAA